MYRILAAFFSVTVIILSIVGVANPTSELSVVMNTSLGIAIVRTLLCLLLLTYSVFPSFRYGLPRKTLALAGAGIVWFFIASLLNDKTPFPGPLDLFFGIEGAVVAAVATLDFERPKAVQRFAPHMDFAWATALLAKVKQLRPQAPPSRQKPVQNY